MIASTDVSGRIAHRCAGVLYWSSLLLLLAAAWVLIDPFQRRCGETVQIYITLAGFEVYVWLLLMLGRWQINKTLIGHAARSGLFAVVLTGLLFIALTELHAARATGAGWLSVLAVGLSMVRIVLASRWLGFRLPAPLLASCGAWVLVLAATTPILRGLADHRSAQHAVAYLICWFVALLVAAHVPLIGWQARRGFRHRGWPMGRWWVPWLLPGVLAAVMILQLYAVEYGLFVDCAQWYFSPIFLAVGMVAVGLGHASGKRVPEAWMVMALAVVHAATASGDPVPDDLPETWRTGAAACLVDPVRPSAVFASVMLVGLGLLLRRGWLISLAFVAPAVSAATQTGQAVWTWRHGKGFAMLIGAFALLGAGVAIQWWQEHRGRWGPIAPPSDPLDPPTTGFESDGVEV